eukprot:47915_1
MDVNKFNSIGKNNFVKICKRATIGSDPANKLYKFICKEQFKATNGENVTSHINNEQHANVTAHENKDFLNIFQLTDEHKQKFIQQGFTNIASLKYIDEYVLYEKIGINNKNVGQEILEYCSQLNNTNSEQNCMELTDKNESKDVIQDYQVVTSSSKSPEKHYLSGTIIQDNAAKQEPPKHKLKPQANPPKKEAPKKEKKEASNEASPSLPKSKEYSGVKTAEAKSKTDIISINMSEPKEIYNLIEELGTGTFGSVYKAQNKKTKKIVAIKKITHQKYQSINQEINALAKC